MQKGPSLHALVQSLTKSEKRYFKRLVEFGTGKKVTNSTLLFDVLEGMKEYDEALLEKQLLKIGLKKQLPVYQTLLFEQIMRSLRMTREKEDLKWKVRKDLTDIAILFERKLYDECFKKVNAALRICQAMSFLGYLQELQGWRYKLMIQRYSSPMDEAFRKNQLDKLENARRSVIDAKAEIAEAYTRRMLRKASYRQNPKWEEELRLAMQDLEAAPPSRHENFPAWMKWVRAKANWTYLAGDFAKAARQYAEVLSALESIESSLNQYSDLYLSILNNYLNCCQLANRLGDYWEKLTKLERLPLKRHQTRSMFRMTAFSQQILYSIHYRPFAQTRELIGSFARWLAENPKEIPTGRLLVTSYNVVSAFFLQGQFQEANEWLNRILNTSDKSERIDIRRFARLFQLVIHYELGNHNLIEYLLPATRRFLNRGGSIDKMDRLLITFFQAKLGQVRVAPDDADLALLQRGITNLQQLKKQDQPFGIGELRYWVESKVQGITIRECFEANAAVFRAQQGQKGPGQIGPRQ